MFSCISLTCWSRLNVFRGIAFYQIHRIGLREGWSLGLSTKREVIGCQINCWTWSGPSHRLRRVDLMPILPNSECHLQCWILRFPLLLKAKIRCKVNDRILLSKYRELNFGTELYNFICILADPIPTTEFLAKSNYFQTKAPKLDNFWLFSPDTRSRS